MISKFGKVPNVIFITALPVVTEKKRVTTVVKNKRL